jgi:flagellar motility protein MotE (MotC chaperone)
MPRQLLGTIQSLQSMAQDMQERLTQIDQNRQDRKAMRSAFEPEKTEMRRIYTEEIKALQDKLSSEQEGRRSETQDLWRQNNDTTREVMTVIKDMIVALENATKVIEQVGFTGDEE